MNQLGVARGVDIQMNELDTCDTSLAWKSMDARHNATTHDAIFPSPFFNFDPMQQVLILRIAQDRSIRDVTQSKGTHSLLRIQHEIQYLLTI